MAFSTTCTKIKSAGGKHYAKFGKREYEFESLAHVKRATDEILTIEVLDFILIKKWLDANPLGQNPGQLEGTTATANFAIANVVRVV